MGEDVRIANTVVNIDEEMALNLEGSGSTQAGDRSGLDTPGGCLSAADASTSKDVSKPLTAPIEKNDQSSRIKKKLQSNR